jgi:L-asparagine oxygenase
MREEHILNLTTKITANPSENPSLFCEQCKNISPLLPENIKQNLQLFFSVQPFFLFRDFPYTYSYTKTPEDSHQHIGETTILAKIQSILLSYLGEMISYEAEGNGYLFQDIIPNKNMATLQTSVGSNIELEIHTEQAFSSLRPDFLSLACLKSDPNALTYILPVNILLQHLSIEEIDLLWKPLWFIGIDLSFKISGKNDEIRGPISILQPSTDPKYPILIFDQDLMTGITEEAQQIIYRIVDIYKKYRFEICLQPGDILLLDNRFVVHGRSSFSPKFDGNDRFLIRAFAVLQTHFSQYQYALSNRMILSQYS